MPGISKKIIITGTVIIAMLFMEIGCIEVKKEEIKPEEIKKPPTKEEFRWGIEAGHLPNRALTLEDLNFIKNNGINWIGVDFIWEKIEPKPGEFDFTYYDWMLTESNKVGLEVLGRLGNGYNGVGEERDLVPDWIDIEDESYPEEISKYIYATVSHYKGRIRYWVVENEANNAKGHKIMGWRQGNWNEEKVRSILEKGCKAVRQADPEAKIIISVCSTIPGWIEYLDKVTNEWKIDYDVVGLQDYPFGILEFGRFTNLTKHIPLHKLKDRVISQMKYECEVARKFKPEVIFTELGFHSRYEQEERQTEVLRYEVKGAIEGKAKGIFWFAYKDDPTDFPEQEKHFGLVKADDIPKPGWFEYKKIIKNPAVLDEIQYEENLRGFGAGFLNNWFMIKIWNTLLGIGEAFPEFTNLLVKLGRV
jgi:arabinogalactan endo-1,4-beta-galactosidase